MFLCIFTQGYYDSSDDGVMDQDGFVSIMARSDDVINVAGHRISTKALEEVNDVTFPIRTKAFDLTLDWFHFISFYFVSLY